MIEIKFRAWDKINKEMLSWYQIINNADKDLLKDVLSCHCCIAMQFTGLKDSKGKEIYKGDIVEGFHGEQSLVKFGIASIDDYEYYGDNRVVGFYLESNGQKFPIEDCYIKEIIGNEFDTSELLKRIK